MATASDRKHGMTLDEMASFVQMAMRTGTPGNAIVKCDATWRQSIKELSVPMGDAMGIQVEVEKPDGS